MQVIGYIRVSTEEQDLEKQEHLLRCWPSTATSPR